MGFMDELKKLTQPYDDEDDYFEGADPKYKTSAPASDAGAAFEDTFGASVSAPAPAKPRKNPFSRAARPAQQPEQDDGSQYDEDPDDAPSGSLFGGFSFKKSGHTAARRGASDAAGSVVMYRPQSYEDARTLVTYLQERRTVVMTLEGIATEPAQRLLDVCSGIALALDCKITPVSGKTFFVTPQGVDISGLTGTGSDAAWN